MVEVKTHRPATSSVDQARLSMRGSGAEPEVQRATIVDVEYLPPVKLQ